MACNDTLCLANQEHSCARGGGCAFGAFYGAGVARGSIGTEVFAFQNGTARLTFGCVDSRMITPGSLDGASGLIGLIRGPLSLIFQVGVKSSLTVTPPISAATPPPVPAATFSSAPRRALAAAAL